MKTCTLCSKEKPPEDFYKRRNAAGENAPIAACKACTKAKVLAYQRANADKKREWERARRLRMTDAEKKNELERQRQWQQGPGREKYLAIRKRSRDRTVEQRKAQWAAYYEANHEALKAKRKAKYDPDKKRASRKPGQSRLDRERRRARLLAAYVEDVPFDYILQRDQGHCGICGKPIMEATIELDHIIPLAADGRHERTNVQLAHLVCNRRKAIRINFTLIEKAA